MVLLERFKFISRLFQILGFAPINVTTKDKTIKTFVDNFVNLIPATSTTFFSLGITYYLLFNPHFGTNGTIHTIINFVLLLSLCLVSATGNFQCFFNRSVHRNINYQIHKVERKMFSAESSIKLTFHIAYRLKILLIFFLFFLSQGLIFYEAYLATSASRMLSSFLTSSFRFVFPVAVCHQIMYSDIISNFIRQLNGKIRNQPACFHSSNKVELLKNIKTMHMDLWRILTQINGYFGLNLLFLVINAFVYMTYQLYWIFVMQLDSDKLGVFGTH